MEVIFKKLKDGASINFSGVHNTIINSIRRTILDDVETMAIEDVEIMKNESPLYDEVIALRLGLIPLKTDLKSYKKRIGDLGDASCEVKFTLDKTGESEYVYSGDLKSSDPNIIPVFDNMPITKLFYGKAIKLKAISILGSGKEHAKWAPAHTYLKETGSKVSLIIEGFGQLKEKEIYNKAIDILNEKIDEFGDLIK